MSSSASRGSLDSSEPSLPAADFCTEISSDELEDSGSLQDVTVFSRSSHMQSLGLYSGVEDLESESDLLVEFETTERLVVTDMPGSGREGRTMEIVHEIERSENVYVVDGGEVGPPKLPEGSFESWNEFKSEFADVLRVSEDRIESGQYRECEQGLNEAQRHDLFVEMITALHDARSSTGNEGGTDSTRRPVGVGERSPTRPRRQLLSLSTLETIPESDLDRMLEAVEGGGAPGANQNTSTDSDVFSQTDSDMVLSPSSPQKLAWGLKEGSLSGSSNEELMEQLLQLSLSQSDGRMGFGEAKLGPGPGTSGSAGGGGDSDVSAVHKQANTHPTYQKDLRQPKVDKWKVPGEAERPTVVIDLRPGRTASTSDVVAQEGKEQQQSERCESSDSEEDDPYTWAQKRRQIKSNIEASAPRLSPSGPPTTTNHTPLLDNHTPTSTQPPTITHHAPSGTTHHTPSNTAHHAPSNTTHHAPSNTAHRTPSNSTHHTPSNTTHHTPSRTTHHALSTFSTSPPSHNLHKVHKVSYTKTSHSWKSMRTKEHTNDTTTKLDSTEAGHRSSNGIASTSEPALEGAEDGTINKSTSQQSKKSSNTGANTSQQVNTHTDTRKPAAKGLATATTAAAPSRQRSSDSLTLSSSYSESEITSSEGTSPSSSSTGVQGGAKKGVAKTSSSGSGGGGGKKGGKQAKKSKKAKKKEQTVPKERSERSQRRRAHVLQRIRQDSLNTSSDEENSLTPLTDLPSPFDPSFPGGMAGSISPVKEGMVEVFRDPEKVKADLQKRILSKKPPSHFETPATDPVFHDDISFGPKLCDSNPSLSCTGLLVLPLMQYGLITLPQPWSQLENMDTQITLHCLVLTWLVCQAAAGYSRATQVESSTLPFRIAGFQQTVLDGHPVILIAIQAKEEKPHDGCTVDLADEDSKEMENFLTNTSIQSLLQPLLADESISSAASLSELASWNALLAQRLSVLFAYQDDISPFTSPVSFYWHSAYHPSNLPSAESLKSTDSISTTLCALSTASLHNPYFIFSVFLQIFTNGLDLAGLRLLFEADTTNISLIQSRSSPTADNEAPPIVALALRGPDAVHHWMNVVGPDDSSLAKVTDPNSISALFGPGLLWTVKSPYQCPAALAKWFGGRACLKTGTIFGMSDPHTKSERRKRQRVRFSESESEDSISSPLPDLIFPPLISNSPCLIAQTYLRSLLVVAPSVPPCCYSSVLAACSHLGFDIFGAKRIRLNAKRAKNLDIPGNFISHFTPSSTPPSPAIVDSSAQLPFVGGVFTSSQAPPPLPSVIFIIGRENSSVHMTPLKKQIVKNLQSMLDSNRHIEIGRGMLDCLMPEAVVHLVPYSEEKLKAFGSFTTSVCTGSTLPPEGEGSEENMLQEELCFVAVPGTFSLPSCMDLLDKVFDVTRSADNSEGRIDFSKKQQPDSSSVNGLDGAYGKFELVGMRIVPQLSRFHAKKLCPLTSSDTDYTQAVQALSDIPATVMVLRGICCNKRIQSCIKQLQSSTRIISLQQKLQFVASQSLSDAVHLSSLFFTGRELFSDTKSRLLAPYVPDAWIHESDILQSFLSPQETLFSVLLLPLSQMKLAVKVLDRLSRAHFEFAGTSVLESSLEKEETCSTEACIAVCVEKVNCVWHLEHLILPFTKDRGSHHLKCSKNFNSAISDLRLYFPDGVFAQVKKTVFKDYNIKPLSEDNFSGLTLSKEYLEKQQSSSNYVSPLLEKTLLLLPPCFLYFQGGKPDTHGFVHVLDFLFQSKFEVCGMKMVQLSSKKAQELKLLLSLDIELEELENLPCLVMVLERDNAASCFQLITKSVLQSFHGPVNTVSKLLPKIIAPSNLQQAIQLFSFFHIENIC